ncbi:MAG: phosphoribosylglycinamide formyltransferase [Rubellimicrobium sp.]|nr:phosphoribosylglycinamide formyltransferase [Rubellimicrobium sp.]
MSRRRLAVLISGTGSNMAALLRSTGPEHPAQPVLVLSDRADAGGIARARALGVPVAVVERRPGESRAGHEARLQAALDAAGADLVCLAGFMRVLSPGFVARWQGRMLNIHPSLLPRHPGLDTHARALAAGDREAGCTVHEVTAALDAGPILGQAVVPVRAGDTADTLAARVLEMEHRLYPAVLRRFAQGDRTPVRLP